MKTRLWKLIGACLLMAFSSPCFALNMEMGVSVEQARKLGVVIKSREDGVAGIRVWLELETKGAFQTFRRVDLLVKSEDQHLASVPVAVTHPTPERISAGFSSHRSLLKSSELQVSVDSKGSIIYRFKLSDFVDLEQFSAGTEEGKAKQAEP